MTGQPLRALRHSSFDGLAVLCRNICYLLDLLRLHARHIAFDDTTEKNLLKAALPRFPQISVNETGLSFIGGLMSVAVKFLCVLQKLI
jgi:hypothetical protein